METLMRIQVVLADNHRQEILEYDISPSSKIENLMKLREIINFVERNGVNYSISIFGQKVSQKHYLKPFDRVEFLKPLKLAPKEWRRKRTSHL